MGWDVTLLISPKEVDQQAVKAASGMKVEILPAVGLTRGGKLTTQDDSAILLGPLGLVLPFVTTRNLRCLMLRVPMRPRAGFSNSAYRRS